MGLAFKPNIDDLRESPAKYIAMKILQLEFGGDVFFSEPNVQNHDNLKLTHYKDAYDKADIVAFLVAHNEFKMNIILQLEINFEFKNQILS